MPSSPSRAGPILVLFVFVVLLGWAGPLAGAESPADGPLAAFQEDLQSFGSPRLRPAEVAGILKHAEEQLARMNLRDLWMALRLLSGSRIPQVEEAGLLPRACDLLRRMLRKKFEGGDQAERLATLTLIAELAEDSGDSENSPLTPLADWLANLTRRGDSPAQRARALRALSRVTLYWPGKDAPLLPALRDAWKADLVVRRSAAEALRYRPRSRFGGAGLLPPELILVAAEGAGDRDATVRRECLLALHALGKDLADSAHISQLSWPRSRSGEKAHLLELAARLAAPSEALNSAAAVATAACKDEDLAVCLAAHDALEPLVRLRASLLALNSRIASLSAEVKEKGKVGVEVKEVEKERPDKIEGKEKVEEGELPPPLEIGPGAGKPAKGKEVPGPLANVVRAVPVLIGSLRSENVEIRLRGIYVLERLGPDAAEACGDLVRLLSDPDRFVRWGAARALRGLAPQGAEKAVPALARLLNDSSRDVRITAAQALARYGPNSQEAVGPLADVVKGRDPEMALLALRALATAGPEASRAQWAILSALFAEQEQVRAEAALTLGQARLTGNRAVREALAEALNDPQGSVRRAAAEALLNSKPLPLDEKTLEEIREKKLDKIEGKEVEAREKKEEKGALKRMPKEVEEKKINDD